jgi:hypothetical protein
MFGLAMHCKFSTKPLNQLPNHHIKEHQKQRIIIQLVQFVIAIT